MAFKIAFFKGNHPGLGGIYSRFVRWWTIGKYSHAELVFSDGISASSAFMDGGVRFKKVVYNDTDWDFLTLPDVLENDAKIWFIQHNGKAYDYWANIRFALGFMPDSKDKYQCIEACMASLGFNDAWRFEPNIAKVVLEKLNS